MKSLREKRKEELKLKIFETSMRLFMEQGYENTTVHQIAQACNMAKGTFFNYFPKKESVLSYIGQIQYQRVKKLLADLEQDKLPADEILKKMFTCLIDKVQENPNLTRTLIVETLRYTLTVDYDDQLMVSGVIAEVIRYGKEQGIFKQDLDSFEIADNLVFLYLSKCCHWARNPEYDIYENWERTLNSYLHGLKA